MAVRINRDTLTDKQKEDIRRFYIKIYINIYKYFDDMRRNISNLLYQNFSFSNQSTSNFLFSSRFDILSTLILIGPPEETLQLFLVTVSLNNFIVFIFTISSCLYFILSVSVSVSVSVFLSTLSLIYIQNL